MSSACPWVPRRHLEWNNMTQLLVTNIKWEMMHKINAKIWSVAWTDSVLYILDMMFSYTCTCRVGALLCEYSQLITFISSLVYQLCHIHHDFGGRTTYFDIFPLWDVMQLRLVVSSVKGTTHQSHLWASSLNLGLEVDLKRRWWTISLHCVTSEKRGDLIYTVEEAWNHTCIFNILDYNFLICTTSVYIVSVFCTYVNLGTSC